MNSILAFFIFSSQTFAASRLPNPCWNSELSVEGERACAFCELEVATEIQDKNTATCKKEILALDQCLNDFNLCGQSYSDLLIEKDNCQTSLIRLCYDTVLIKTGNN